MITNFKARLCLYPEIEDKETKKMKKIGAFTIGKKYKVYAVFDSGAGFTDFLISDNEGIYRWVNMTVFREAKWGLRK